MGVIMLRRYQKHRKKPEKYLKQWLKEGEWQQ